MTVVLTNPFCLPYVLRGSERNLDVLAAYLAALGHEVITVSGRPGPKVVEDTDNGKRILNRPYWTPALGAIRITAAHTFFYGALRSLRSLEPDVVHSMFFSDAIAASLARRSRKYRIVYQLNGVGIAGVSCHRWWPPEGWMFRQAIGGADGLITVSNFIRELVRTHYGVDSEVIPSPVDIDGTFPLGAGPADGRPTILSAADFTDRRKGVRVLVEAFRLVKTVMPEAVLNLAGRVTDELRTELLRDVPDHVARDLHILGQVREGLSDLYRGCNVMALPSMWEPSGTVMVEAWASGAVVVATNHAGLPEFMGPDVNVLFEPLTGGIETHNARGLADALLHGIELSQRPGAREKCRKHAEQYSTRALCPRILKLYEQC